MLFRRGMRSLLTAETGMSVLDEASDLAEAIDKARSLRPDVLVIDVSLLKGGAQEAEGLSQPTLFRRAQLPCPVLWLAQADGEHDLQLAISAGARAYMLRSSAPGELIAGIRQVSAIDEDNPLGLSKISPDLQALAASSERFPHPPLLTAREEEVVRLLVEGRTAREVAVVLALSLKTVEAHKLNLMRKLDVHNRVGLVEYAVRTGLISPSVAG